MPPRPARPAPARLSRRRVLAALLTACGLAAGTLLAPGAVAAPPPAPLDSAVGYDVSWPQCSSRSSPDSRPLPASASFGVVGVNGGKPENGNSCFSQQYAWARDVATGKPALYVNVANPVAAGQKWGPYTGPRPCDSSNADDRGCAFDYGYTWGTSAVARLDNLAVEVRALTWWLDVELCSGCNPWRTDTDAGRAANQASVAGMAAALQARPDRVASVGIYTTGYQWKAITGQAGGLPVMAGTDGLPLWYPVGGDGRSVALGHCGDRATPNGGSVALVQWLDSNSPFDQDQSCAPLAPTISRVTQGAIAGDPVTVAGSAPAGETLTVSVGDSFTPARDVTTVVVDAAGHWSYVTGFTSNGTVAVRDRDGLSAGTPVAVGLKVGMPKVRGAGIDRRGLCLRRLDGTTFPFAPGQQAIVRGRFDKQVGYANVRKRGGSGIWTAKVPGACGVASSVKVTVAGVLRPSGQRYATDGRTPAVVLAPRR